MGWGWLGGCSQRRFSGRRLFPKGGPGSQQVERRAAGRRGARPAPAPLSMAGLSVTAFRQGAKPAVPVQRPTQVMVGSDQVFPRWFRPSESLRGLDESRRQGGERRLRGAGASMAFEAARSRASQSRCIAQRSTLHIARRLARDKEGPDPPSHGLAPFGWAARSRELAPVQRYPAAEPGKRAGQGRARDVMKRATRIKDGCSDSEVGPARVDEEACGTDNGTEDFEGRRA